MAAPPSKTRSALEKFLGADHVEPESRAPSITNADPYIEQEPTVGEFFREITPTSRQVGEYFYSLFPFLSWIGKYNFIWFIGDFIAGMFLFLLLGPPNPLHDGHNSTGH